MGHLKLDQRCEECVLRLEVVVQRAAGHRDGRHESVDAGDLEFVLLCDPTAATQQLVTRFLFLSRLYRMRTSL
jgi:hypothetical protein